MSPEKSIVYLEYAEVVRLHFQIMSEAGDDRCGVFDENSLKSALARPQQAAIYENADVFRQAATLWFGLVKNHPWRGGNRRTATFATKLFLERNGFELCASTAELIELCAFVQTDVWKVDEIENWLRQRVNLCG